MNIDTAIKRIKLFDCIESIDFRGWFEVISSVETEEKLDKLNYNSVTQILTVNIPNYKSNNYVQIFNLNGNEVMKFQITNNVQNIDLSTLERGFYIIRFGNSIEKIIIQ